MKSPLLFVILLCVALTGAYSQQAQESVASDFKGVTVAFHSDPQRADAKLLPLIDGKTGAGSKERFGLCLGTVSASGNVLEILNKDGLVLKSISIGELLTGKGSGFALLSQPPAGSQSRWIEKRYAVDLPKGKVQLLLKALATGDASSDQHLIVTFALKSDVPATLALRASLPVAGILETSDKGFVLASKSGAAAIAASVYPGTAGIRATKSLVTLTSGTTSLDGLQESALLWLVLDGVSSSAAGTAKQQALKILSEKRFPESDPRVVVVSSTDKPTTQPGEIVTYTLVCRNIGTGDATDVALSNPVSEGTQYVEGSATSDGCSLSFGSSGNTVRQIHWTFHVPIKPGQERQVSFKVQVK